ncbi:putative vacuolar protein sorting-associated protein 16 homolog [Rhizoctonia solani AG-1 IB]|uniref:Probable vacuolar protein sorting-associated protein 16 homolog n=1 Tax=Thanatephorus cucumeris (strain AG1-IB / isolate 7/3/14) TaxID=1108050 RepID=M5BVL2_THACB|nr:putative vacuolar protein sorting-associated protein 16 homolog [Rhizoctonia solani AG-1 IB]
MTGVPNPTTTWEPVQDGEVFYSTREVYQMMWQLNDLTDFIIAGARYGGPLALMRDTSKLVALGRHSVSKPQIIIYSSAGNLINTIPWDQGKVVSMGWTHDERLVALNEEGTYRIHDLSGAYTQHSLGTDAADIGIQDARIHEHGLVALTNQLTFLEVKAWTGTKPLALALPDPSLDGAPHGWSIVPPDATISRHIEVLVASGNTILSVDALECVDQRVGRGPFLSIAPSPNGKSIALLTSSGLVWVVSADFTKSYAEYDSTQDSPALPKQVVWCGSDAVVLSYASGLLVILGPFGDTIKHYYPGAPHVVGEVDGARVVCVDRCDWVQKVPQSSMNALGPTSTHPAALLLHAAEQFSQRVPSAHDSVRAIRPELAGAVDVLVDAAGREWDGVWQRKLMNAAAFGRGFLDMCDPTDFVAMGKTLKVLNAARYYEIGIPITYAQYQHTSATHIIARLTARNEHLLALRIAEFLGQPPDTVLKHWACAKIAKSVEDPDAPADKADADVCRAIVEKFRATPGASFADIAKRAWEVGRGRLATMLLDHEPRPGEQVPLLLQMKEERLALIKAVNSGDTDLVYLVLLQLKKQSSLGDFFRLLEEGGEQYGPAVRLLEVYAREQDRELLKDFYYQDDKRVASALLALDDARAAKMADNRIELVRAAAKFFSEDRERGWEAKAMDENVRLLTFQQQLEKDLEGRVEVVGLSVNATIRVFWYIKLYALTELRDWDGLEQLAKSRRSPIGYEPFVTHLVAQGHLKQAASYVPRCDAPKRADLYVKCGEWGLAGEECKSRGDKTKLEEIRKRAPNNLVARELDQILSTMR